jgi:hypothetical protein
MRPLGRRIYSLIGISVVVMLISGTMLVLTALADEGSTSGSDLCVSGQTREQIAKAAYQDFIAKLTANPGIGDTSKVDSGVKSALSQMVEERRQSGKLTQDQTDKLKQRIYAEEFSGGFRGLLGGRHSPRMMGK